MAAYGPALGQIGVACRVKKDIFMADSGDISGGNGADAQSLAFFLDFEPPANDFRADVIAGLSQSPSTLSPKYFYDAHGSHLFDLICETKEYYVTRTELALLEQIGPELRARIGANAHVVEYGAGSVVKIRLLMDALEKPASYVAIDISRDHLVSATKALAKDYANVEIGAICADFTTPFHLPESLASAEGVVLGFLPGSTIGNFVPDAAVEVLSSIHDHIGVGGQLLIGIDLIKDVVRLEVAYADAAGYTAAFNLNVLRRMKTELDASLSISDFRHVAKFNHEKARIEMHLEAVRPTEICLDGQTFVFAAGETIHTENSHKYTVESFQALALRAGFVPEAVWTDADNLFSLHLLKAE